MSRRLLTGLLLGLFGSCAAVAVPADAQAHCLADGQKALQQVADRQAIEYLRRQYAVATDLFGMGGAEQVQRAQAIYQRIFTEDASIRVIIDGQVTRQARGPDGWALEVQRALQPYAGVQHLIGSQLVEFACSEDAASPVSATMSSYLQAWHDRPGEDVYLFIGTYHDRVRLVPGIGWQIHDMELQRVSTARLKH
ncbi:MAG: nuclear transport factor 2 family protein [Pseudomonas sp.]|jgi:hypothetical protein